MGKLSLVKQYFIDYIDNIVKNNKVSHAYLFEVDNYEEDIIYIYDFIKMILSNSNYNEVKESDNPIFSQIDNNNYPDIKVIEPDGSTIKKNQLLELQKDFNNKSLLNGKRIYIIMNAEKLNSSSANTMLKFLEEPEDDIIAFLITDNRYHVIETILSRCQILNLKENSFDYIIDDDILDLLKCVIKPNDFFIKYNYFINKIIVDKNSAKEKLIVIENIIIAYLNQKYNKSSVLDVSVCSLLESVDSKDLLKCLSILEDEIPKLEFNVNYKLWIDSLFSKLVVGG